MASISNIVFNTENCYIKIDSLCQKPRIFHTRDARKQLTQIRHINPIENAKGSSLCPDYNRLSKSTAYLGTTRRSPHALWVTNNINAKLTFASDKTANLLYFAHGKLLAIYKF